MFRLGAAVEEKFVTDACLLQLPAEDFPESAGKSMVFKVFHAVRGVDRDIADSDATVHYEHSASRLFGDQAEPGEFVAGELDRKGVGVAQCRHFTLRRKHGTGCDFVRFDLPAQKLGQFTVNAHVPGRSEFGKQLFDLLRHIVI